MIILIIVYNKCMKKIAIIVDSFTGFSKKEIEGLGLLYINHTVILDGKPYKEGIEMELKDCFQYIDEDLTSKTSMPSIGIVIDLFETLSKEYEKVIYLPMNKGFSSTFSTAAAASNEFDNISVVETKLITRGLVNTAIKMKEMIEAGKTEEEAVAFLRKVEETSHSYVIPQNVDALVRGGRLNSAKKVIMQKGKLIPRLEVIMDGFKTSKIGRNMNKVIKSTVAKMNKAIEEKTDEYNWEVIYAGNEKTKKFVTDAFKEIGVTSFIESWTSSVIAVHTGTGAIGINIWKK